jgi:hypothetical protein
VVRRSAAVLARTSARTSIGLSRRLAPVLALAAGTAYLLLAGSLPSVDGDAGRYLAGCAGALAVALCVYAALPGREATVTLLTLGFGAALLAIALNARDVGAAADPVEALFAAAAGLLFAIAFDIPAAVVALPLLVAGIDLASALGGGSAPLVRPGNGPDVLTLDLPRWGGGGNVAQLGLLDATFLALFASWSLRHALRPRLALPLMAAGLAGSVALGVALGDAVPALPFLAAGLLLPAADRIPRLLRSE